MQGVLAARLVTRARFSSYPASRASVSASSSAIFIVRLGRKVARFCVGIVRQCDTSQAVSYFVSALPAERIGTAILVYPNSVRPKPSAREH